MRRKYERAVAVGKVVGGACAVLILSACGLTGGQKASDEIDTDEEITFSMDTAVSDSAEWEGEDDKSLNDIRFAGFEEKDWLDNEYIRTLRRYIDAFVKGDIEDEELEPYKKVMKGRFCIFNIAPFIGGGAYIHFLFYDRPELLFVSWVYSDVNIETEKVTSYHVQSVSMKETIGLTKEDVDEVLKGHPELKLW